MEGVSSTANNSVYQNLTHEGNPTPCCGMVRYAPDYVNTRPLRYSWYDRLQLILPLTMEWLRNAWGNVDEFSRHVYDVLQQGLHVFLPYDKLSNAMQRKSSESETETSSNMNLYSTLQRPIPVISATPRLRSEEVTVMSPSSCEDSSTRETI